MCVIDNVRRRRNILQFVLATGIILSLASIVVPDATPFFISRAYAYKMVSGFRFQVSEPADTAKHVKPRYSVRHTTTETTDDVRHRSSDLKDPNNMKTEVTYDEKDGTYTVGTVMTETKDGDKDGSKSSNGSKSTSGSKGSNSSTGSNGTTQTTNVKFSSFLPGNSQSMNLQTATSYVGTPVTMTAQEYMDWSLRQSLRQYYRQRNEEQFESKGKDKFDFTDMHFSLGPAEKIFGPGGVQIKTQGSAELKMGINMKSTDNPTLAASRRNSLGMDMDMKINLRVNGKIGDKMDMNLNYNSESQFDYDAQNLKLKYDGKEDEIIKLVEAGNISMPSNMSLVPGISSLFGVRTDLQFGKLKLQAVVSQKKSASTSTSSKGGVSTTSYEMTAADYEENKHFYLAQFFRDKYDDNMKTLPTITSGISIKRIEVWVTNKTGTTTNTRNIIALTSLGETADKFLMDKWTPLTTSGLVFNNANNLYKVLLEDQEIRDLSKAGGILDGMDMQGSVDYEKLQSARLLSSSDYHLNADLGTLTLNTALQPDEILAVAYEYTYAGQTYQVGEFSSDVSSTTSALMVKMLKGTTMTRSIPNWDLMMRNVYSLGATTTEKDKFKLDIKYQSDSTGVYLTYFPIDSLKNTILLKAMGLDRLDANNKPNPNSQFDYIDGYTIYKGRIYFPVAEPFGSHIRDWIVKKLTPSRGKAIAEQIAAKYTFQELYDTTKTAAKQMAEKNKYLLTGEYKGSSANEIDLGVTNVAQGSVVVTAGGVTLVENTDYTVDYAMGRVTIINQSIIDAGTTVNASVESNDTYDLQRKTFLGLNFDYEYSKNLTFGGTIQYLSEQPLTTKITMGNEALKNVLWGAHVSWKHQAQWLTNWMNKIPFLHATKPSQISFDGQVAQLIAGQSGAAQGGASYLDDFEDTKKKTSLIQPTYWQLSSVPSLKPESKLTNDTRYGYNRALLAWYCVDPIFTNRSSTLTPSFIKSNPDLVSNHYVRPVYELELYPNRTQTSMNNNATLNVLNMAYYPKERGPYNLDTNIDPATGLLRNPENRWGGMMRKMDNTDFEAQNIEYIEFWLLDPFYYQRENGTRIYGGDLNIDLGEISEDILKDGKKFYESGIPIDDNETYLQYTPWGKVPNTTSVTYAFNNESGARNKQDVGLDGLTDEEEQNYDPEGVPSGSMTYKKFHDMIDSRQLQMPDSIRDQLLLDPANDNYHYFRGDDYDDKKVDILRRYKRINMPQGNSPESGTYSYETAWKSTPDVEDINTDYTLNESDKYWHYVLPITDGNLRVGGKYISEVRPSTVTLRNGNVETINWYLVRIPLNDSQKESVGGISDFSSIRFMRMYLDNFEDSVILRFGTLDLVHGDWRTYTNTLYQGGTASSANTDFSVISVNIEENNDREPVNYVVPPGISRITDTTGSQLVESNEQALAMIVKNLGSNDARAVYKGCKYDMRKYKHLQLFAHANQLAKTEPGYTPLQSSEVSVFIRLGSDYRSNYYEYEVPLQLTPIKESGKYSGSDADRLAVWPQENMLDFNLELLTSLKKARNKSGVNYSQLYTGYDPDKPNNRIAIMGNPSLGEVKTIMIGVRNHADANRSAEVWVNELRLQEFTNDGGWAAQGTLNIQLSDIGSFNATGKVITAGYGGIEQSVSDRTDENDYNYQFTTSLDLGRLLPDKAKVSVPFYYSYGKDIVKPKYNPLDTDMKLDDALDALQTQEQKDSLSSLTTKTTTTSNMSISGAKINIATKKHPMPYDPANFTFSYSQSNTTKKGQTTVYEYNTSWKAAINYSWSPNWKYWEPFKNWKTKSKWAQIIKDQNLALAPQSVTLATDLSRTYYELQERDLENTSDPQSLPVQWSSNFLWNRSMGLRWDIFKALHFNFQSATHAEVEEPYCVVNKDLYPEQYQAWKDSVLTSLAHWGRPLDYSQSVTMSYKLPINKIPVFDWITADGTFNSSYSWKRGSTTDEGVSLGNTVNTQRTVNVNGKFAMETLYNHSKFLQEANKRFSASKAKSSADKKRDEKKKQNEAEKKQKQESKANKEELMAKAKEEAKKTKEPVDSIFKRLMAENTPKTPVRQNTTTSKKDDKKKTKGFSQELTLLPDTTITIAHNQKSKRLYVRFQDEKGKDVDLKFKKLDDNKILVKTSAKDTSRIKLNVIAKPKISDQKWYTWAQAGARLAMMLRSASLSYRNTYNLYLPGFNPEVGDFFGQTGAFGNGLAPGLDFAFGFVGDSYIDKAAKNRWLLGSDINTSPATTAKTEDIQLKMSLEPFTDLKVDLNMSRTINTSKSIQYMYDNRPTTRSGSFNMTTISLVTAFKSRGNADNGYASSTFDNFRKLLDAYQERVEAQYIGHKDPLGNTYIGSKGTAASGVNNTPANKYGPDVMVPAFLAAYCGGGTTRELNIFPSLLQMLPNWTLTYKGLGNLPYLRDLFKSVTVTHGYKSIYSVGSYSSFTSWQEASGFAADNELGFITNSTTGEEVYAPSSPYDVSSVSINESFCPLVGLNLTFNNNMTLKAEYRTTRVLALSMTSAQITETGTNDFVLGWGYKIDDFKLSSLTRLFGIGGRASIKANKGRNRASARKTTDDTNSRNTSAKTSASSRLKNIAHALNMRFDFSIRSQDAIRRDIQTGLSEATSGNKAFKTAFQLDYTMSKYVTFTLYYDRQHTIPLLSNSSYPTVTQDFGFTMKFNLTR